MERTLVDAGVSVVIYANHLIRSAYPAMVKTAKSILRHGRCEEASKRCMPIKEILTLIPGSDGAGLRPHPVTGVRRSSRRRVR